MTQTVNAVDVVEFETLVKNAYQGSAKLLPFVRKRTNVIGRTVDFPKLGKGIGHLRGTPSSDLVPANLTWTKATATIADYYFADYSDIFDDYKNKVDEAKELVFSTAMGCGRLVDQAIINALEAGKNSTTISVNEGGTNSGLNIEKIKAAGALFDALEIPENDRYFVAHSNGKESLLSDVEATSGDYMNVKALVNGTINDFYGFKFIWIGTRAEGGLTLSTNTRYNYAFHGGVNGAVGAAMNGAGVQTKVDYVPTKASYLVNSMVSVGAVGIDSDGIYRVETYEA